MDELVGDLTRSGAFVWSFLFLSIAFFLVGFLQWENM